MLCKYGVGSVVQAYVHFYFTITSWSYSFVTKFGLFSKVSLLDFHSNTFMKSSYGLLIPFNILKLTFVF